jgi:beta-lactamase regulating signal transducer with metallopeptidase domain
VEALVNWVWQGCAVTLAASLLARLSPGMSATTRYRLWWMTLTIVLLLPVLQLVPRPVAVDLAEPSATIGSSAVAVPLPALPWWPAWLIVAGWTAWASFALWRTAGALVRLRSAKRSCRPFPEAREAGLEAWNALRTYGRAAALVVSDEVPAAAVLGLTSPAIAIAPSVLQELNDRELDQVLVHEWAHVQRRDDLARLVQLLVRAVAGFHPAVWWIDRRLDVERETACDDWAVNVTGSARRYAACLVKLAALQGQSPLQRLIPAVLSSPPLTTRVERLLDQHRNTSTRLAFSATAVIVLVLAAIATSARSVELVITPADASGRAASSPAALLIATDTSARLPIAPPESEERLARRATPARQREVRKPIPASVRHEGLSSAPGSRGDRSNVSVLADADASAHRAEPLPPVPAVVEAPPTPATVDLPGTSTPVAPDIVAGLLSPSTMPPSANRETPWGAAAGAGVSVGRGSQKAAVATAGFFSRLGKSIANNF